MNRFTRYLANKKDVIAFVFIILLSMGSMAFETTTSRNAIATFFLNITGFFQNAGSSIGRFVGDTVNSVGELRELKVEYDQLLEEVAQYRLQSINIDELERENRELRAMIGFRDSSSDELIPAQVIAKSPGVFSDEFIVNRGSRDGILVDSPVVAVGEGRRILVGKVVEVGESVSMVLPVFSASLFVTARIADSRFEGLVSGMGTVSRELSMDYVDRNARSSISLGSEIITSGFDSLYPRGLLIGTVAAIEGQVWETSIQLKVQPAVQYSRLEYVFILKTTGGE